MNDHIKSKIQQKNFFFKQYVKNRKTAHDYKNLQLTTKIYQIIRKNYKDL